MYEFHVGDYVETIDGAVGYLVKFSTSGDHFLGTVDIKGHDNWEYAIYFKQFPEYFNQIGKYKFNQKIKHLKREITDDYRVFNKINEIIDWINNHEE